MAAPLVDYLKPQTIQSSAIITQEQKPCTEMLQMRRVAGKHQYKTLGAPPQPKPLRYLSLKLTELGKNIHPLDSFNNLPKEKRKKGKKTNSVPERRFSKK